MNTIEFLAFFGVLISLTGMFTCMGWGETETATSNASSEPIDSDNSFYEGFDEMKNPFHESQSAKDSSLSLAEEMDKEKDRMDV